MRGPPRPDPAVSRRTLLQASGIALAGSVAGCSGTDSSASLPGWRTFRYDQRNTGYNPSTAAPTQNLAVDTRYDIRCEEEPIVADGTVYAVGDGTLTAFDPSADEVRWQTQSGGCPPSVGPDGGLFAAGGAVSALDPSDGTEQWHFLGTDSTVATIEGWNDNLGTDGPPTVADGTVYVVFTASDSIGNEVLTTSFLFALDATDGSVLWSYHKYEETEQYQPLPTPNGTPVVVDDRLFVTTSASTLLALDATSGEAVWHGDPGSGITTSPVVRNGMIYAGTGDGLVAANVETGEQEWEAEVELAATEPVVTDDKAFFISVVDGRAAQLSAVDVATGEEVWRYDCGEPIGRLAGAENTLYASVGGRGAGLYAFEMDNGTVSGFLGATEDRLPIEPVPAADRLYVRIASGKPNRVGSPYVNDGTLGVIDDDGDEGTMPSCN